jgi:hypothetical protein
LANQEAALRGVLRWLHSARGWVRSAMAFQSLPAAPPRR